MKKTLINACTEAGRSNYKDPWIVMILRERFVLIIQHLLSERRDIMKKSVTQSFIISFVFVDDLLQINIE